VTLARALTDTFAGIRPADVPGFVVAQLTGAMGRDVPLPMAGPGTARNRGARRGPALRRVAAASTTRLTAELAQQTRLLVTMGCGDECPYVPGAERDDWPLDDPNGKPIVKVREIRDDIRERVRSLIDREGWS
jgi:hypothetical protein